MSRGTERLVETLEELIGDMVEKQIEDNTQEIDADNVNGLDEFIESRIVDLEFDADKVNGLERFVEDIIDNHEHEVKAENVDGLEDAINERVANVLDDELKNKVNEVLNDGDGYRVNPTAVAEAFKDPEVKAALDVALKESLLRVLTTLLIGSVPIAAPVTPVATSSVLTPVEENKAETPEQIN